MFETNKSIYQLNSDEVKEIQLQLVRVGYLQSSNDIDGIFGSITEKAFEKFKSDHKLTNPQEIGMTTWQILQKVPTKKITQYYELTIPRLTLLDTIAYTEGTDRTLNPNNRIGYNICFTGASFNNGWVDHPRQMHNSGSLYSDAAGRYQFLSVTWDVIAHTLKLPDFSPQSQDQGAMWLIHVKRLAIAECDRADLTGICKKLSLEWASLPFSPYGQPTFSFREFTELYMRIMQANERC